MAGSELPGLAPGGYLPPDLMDHALAEGAAERPGGQGFSAAAQNHHGAADRRGQRTHYRIQAALLEHQPLQPLVGGDAALKHLVLLVHEVGERLLGERDERELVGHLEYREAELAG